MDGAWRQHRAFHNVDVQILFPVDEEKLLLIEDLRWRRSATGQRSSSW
jgi:hypothetical protein